MNMPGTRVALLLNFVPPYRIPLFQRVAKRVDELKIFIATPMEPNRLWPADWQDLNVCVQKNFTVQRTWKHPSGFEDQLYIHFSYDTLLQLWRYQPDVIISGELGLRSIQAMLYRKLRLKTRLILWCTLSDHTEQGRGRLREQIRRWLLPNVDAVLVNGGSGARYVRRFGVLDEKIFRVPYTPQTELFTAPPLERPFHNSIRLLAIGQLIPRKGLIPFLNILIQWAVAHPQQLLEFQLAGSGPLYQQLASYPCPPNLKMGLLGQVEYPDLPALYHQADILAFPTLADEWGIVVNEAMASGLPVLGSKYSQAVEELVQDDKTGWTFRPDHPDEVQQALDHALLIKPDDLANMRLAVRNVAGKITPVTMAENILNAIKFVRA